VIDSRFKGSCSLVDSRIGSQWTDFEATNKNNKIKVTNNDLFNTIQVNRVLGGMFVNVFGVYGMVHKSR